MPVLIDLHERFNDKGLAIVGVHVDTLGEVDSPAEFDEKIAPHKKELWHGKDLPFSVALTYKNDSDDALSTDPTPAVQYGIRSYPTTVLIDRQGKVVREFAIYESSDVTAQIEELLQSKD